MGRHTRLTDLDLRRGPLGISASAAVKRRGGARRLAERAGFGMILLAVTAGSFGLVTRLLTANDMLAATGLSAGDRDYDLERAAALARDSLTLLADAHRSNDYSRFWHAAAPSFQAVNAPARLSAIFAGQRAYNLDIAAIVRAPPRWLKEPRIDADGRLLLEALYPASGHWLLAQIAYEATRGEWRLNEIALSLRDAAG